MTQNKTVALLLGAVLLLGGLSGGVWWALQEAPPEDVPEEGAATEEDTGMSRTRTEELMRTIGYVQ